MVNKQHLEFNWLIVSANPYQQTQNVSAQMTYWMKLMCSHWFVCKLYLNRTFSREELTSFFLGIQSKTDIEYHKNNVLK